MGCSKDSGYSVQGKKSGELYGHPAGPGFGLMQEELPGGYEVDCIRVEKIYERCKVVATNEKITDLCGIAEGDIVKAWCVDVELVVDHKHPFKCEKIPHTKRARTSFWYRYRFGYSDQTGTKYFTSEPVFFEKMVIMSHRIFDDRLFVQCEVFLKCAECFVSGPQQVTCCIGKMILINLMAQVELLVPTFGFCPPPDDCSEVATGCDEVEFKWPPFPRQPRPPSVEVGEEENGDISEGD